MNSTVRPFRFGRFEVRPAQRQLLISDEGASIGARAFDMLVALIERRDRVVSRDELFSLVWPGLVAEENNLRQLVRSRPGWRACWVSERLATEALLSRARARLCRERAWEVDEGPIDHRASADHRLPAWRFGRRMSFLYHKHPVAHARRYRRTR